MAHRWQNRLLLVASYVFYGAWDWRFLSLIWISTLIDYWCGQQIGAAADQRDRRKFLTISMLSNLGILGFFKYFGFFTDSLNTLFLNFGYDLGIPTLKILLPVGISFYTFQSMSYTIDIYHKKLKPVERFSDFALFVAFFPQLVAGPIERAKHLLPQIANKRKIQLDEFYEGWYLIFWGMFQKVFVADNVSKISDTIFALGGPYDRVEVLIGAYAFSFQIFCDFAGYSNIARGLCKVMGFDIMVNFNLPYFAKNPSDFWRRWHISLSTWLKDYLYIPLGGNRGTTYLTLRNLMLTMLLGGLWHGAAWTFVWWGAYHGFLLIVYRAIDYCRGPVRPKGESKSKILSVLNIIFFYHLICYGWILFRAQSMDQVVAMTSGLIFNTGNIAVIPDAEVYAVVLWKMVGKFVAFMSILWAVQLIQYFKSDLLAPLKWHWISRGVFYFVCIMLIIVYGETNAKDFIYFQF